MKEGIILGRLELKDVSGFEYIATIINKNTVWRIGAIK